MIKVEDVFIKQKVMSKFGEGVIDDLYVSDANRIYAVVSFKGNISKNIPIDLLVALDKRSVNFFYRSFEGSKEFSEETNTFFGKILNIRDTISYTSTEENKLSLEFHKAVDNYIISKDPIKPDKKF